MVKYFHFHDSITGDNFDAPLISDQCTMNKIDGTRCKKRCQIGVSICWVHLLSLNNLRIKKSTIPNSGLGLFALRKNNTSKLNKLPVFKIGQKITAYGGDIIDEGELLRRYGDKTAPYTYDVGDDSYEDAALVRGVGSTINHKSESKKNCECVVGRNGRLHIRATKKIFHGKELYLNYHGGKGNVSRHKNYKFNEKGVKSSTNSKRYTV